MKKIMLFLLWSFVTFAQEGKPTGAWLPVHVKWEHAPPSVNPKLETGATTVLYFNEHGRFAVIECVVNREPGQYTTVSHGDGQVVSLGEWDGRLPGQVKYRIVGRTVPLKGETLPGPWHEKKLSSTREGYLLFEGKLYHHVEALEPSVRELLQGIPTTP
jgi:hypothetical protein